jgi:hypothetical protein
VSRVGRAHQACANAAAPFSFDRASEAAVPAAAECYLGT